MVNPVIIDGKLILVNGTLAGALDCCCGTVGPVSEEYEVCPLCPDACPTVGGFVNPPSIALTLFDADYAGGSKTWCGISFSLADIQAGVTKCACPNNYNLDNTPVLGPPTLPVYGVSGNNREEWRRTGGASELFLFRSMSWSSIFPMVVTHYYKFRQMIVQLNYAGQAFGDSRSSRQDLIRFSGGTITYTSINTQQDFPILSPGINPSNASVNAVADDYRIRDDQFGNFTDPNGLNWKWERGSRWN